MCSLQTKIQELIQNFEDHLSREDMLALQSVLKQTSETNSERLADKHTRKINYLISKETHRSTVVDREKWVVNISKRVMTPVETAALKKGINFSITPRKVPVSKMLSSIETGIYNLSQSAKDTIRVSVANSLKTCKLPTAVNVTREEERALNNLRKDEEVTNVPADKGRPVVVMDKDEYQEKASVLLNDTDKRSNPTSNVEKELNKLLLNIKEEKDDSGSRIGLQLYKKLHCSNSMPASFYGLPKIHKPERRLRPITSSVGSLTYAVSKHLLSILSPLRRNPFSVKNSSEFAPNIQQHTVASEEIMVCFDV